MKRVCTVVFSALFGFAVNDASAGPGDGVVSFLMGSGKFVKCGVTGSDNLKFKRRRYLGEDSTVVRGQLSEIAKSTVVCVSSDGRSKITRDHQIFFLNNQKPTAVHLNPSDDPSELSVSARVFFKRGYHEFRWVGEFDFVWAK